MTPTLIIAVLFVSILTFVGGFAIAFLFPRIPF